MERKRIKFRASGVGALMIGGTSWTDKQEKYLQELLSRQNGTFLSKTGKALGLSPNMKDDLKDLLEKKKAPFEFGATAKNFIRDVWYQETYGYRQVVMTKEMLKGHLCEQDSIGLLDEVDPIDSIRVKNKDRITDFYFTGECDIHRAEDKIIEDVKTSWDLSTFSKVESIPENYYAQGQVYMHLYGCNTFRLCYCLVNTPAELILEEQKRYWYRFGAPDQTNYAWNQTESQIEKNHIVDHIPAEERVKIFEFDKNDEYINELMNRCDLAQDVFYGFGKKRQIVTKLDKAGKIIKA